MKKLMLTLAMIASAACGEVGSVPQGVSAQNLIWESKRLTPADCTESWSAWPGLLPEKVRAVNVITAWKEGELGYQLKQRDVELRADAVRICADDARDYMVTVVQEP